MALLRDKEESLKNLGLDTLCKSIVFSSFVLLNISISESVYRRGVIFLWEPCLVVLVHLNWSGIRKSVTDGLNFLRVYSGVPAFISSHQGRQVWILKRFCAIPLLQIVK